MKTSRSDIYNKKLMCPTSGVDNALAYHYCDPSSIHVNDSVCMWKGMVVARLTTWVFSGHSNFLLG